MPQLPSPSPKYSVIVVMLALLTLIDIPLFLANCISNHAPTSPLQEAMTLYKYEKFDELHALLNNNYYEQYPTLSIISGDLFLEGKGVPQNSKKAEAYYRYAAEANDPLGQYKLGKLYCAGIDGHKFYTEALLWLTKAGNQGNAAAMNEIGMMYEEGKGVSKNYQTAFAWYQQAATLNNAGAQFNIGYLYHHGFIGDSPNFKEAMQWYTRASEQGHPAGLTGIGQLYENGQGVQKDCSAAIEWYKKADILDDSWGQHNLALMYYKGICVEKNDKEALRLFKKSSKNGNASAINYIGLMHELGIR